MLEEQRMKRRERRDVRGKITAQAVGPQAKDSKGIKLSKCVCRNWTKKVNCRESKCNHMRLVLITCDANPRGADGGGGIPIKFPPMGDSICKVEEGLFLRVQISNDRR